MNPVEPLPDAWRAGVIAILRKGSPVAVRWSLRARQDWQQFGLGHQAFELVIRTLGQPGIWGERVLGMTPLPCAPSSSGAQVVYGFLCAHPLGGPKPLYAKIGMFDDRVTLDLFSLHIDLTGDLAQRIAKAQRPRK